MSNSLTYSGDKFTLVLDEPFSARSLTGSLYNRSLNEALLVINSLLHTDCVTSCGAVNTVVNGANASGATNGLAAYLGLPKSGVNQRTYLATGSANQTKYFRRSDGAFVDTNYSASKMLSSNPYITSSTMANDVLVCGMGSLYTGSAPQIEPDRMILFGGTQHASITAGTATFTTSSKTVTLSSALSVGNQAAIVGSFIVNTQDSAPCAYRITAVNSSTSIEIDRAYAGSRSASASTYIINPAYSFTTAATVDCSSGGYLVGRSCVSAWGRLAILNTTSNSSSLAKDFVKSRIRWSGLIGSDEGTAPFRGMFAWDPSGYVDLPEQGGPGIQLIKHGNAVVALQQYGMTAIYGSPVFNDVGSLDVSNFYGNMSPICAVSTPYGLFIVDKNDGLLVWNGGTPQPVRNGDVGLPNTMGEYIEYGICEIAYYKDYLFINMSNTGTSSAVESTMVMYHIPTARWGYLYFSNTSSSGVNYRFIQRSADDGIVGIEQYIGPTNLYKIANAIDGANGASQTQVTTTYYGDFLSLFRPEKLILTYASSGSTTTSPQITIGDIAESGKEILIDNTSTGYLNALDLLKETTKTAVIEIPSTSIAEPKFLFSLIGSNIRISRIIIQGTVEGMTETETQWSFV